MKEDSSGLGKGEDGLRLAKHVLQVGYIESQAPIFTPHGHLMALCHFGYVHGSAPRIVTLTLLADEHVAEELHIGC